jgi:hypothetical protein
MARKLGRGEDIFQDLDSVKQQLFYQLPVLDSLLESMKRAGDSGTSAYRVLQIEIDRIRNGELTDTETFGFNILAGGLAIKYGILGSGGIPNV